MSDNAGTGRISYLDGAFVPHEDARLSIASHVVNYGTGCFEGIRAYWNDNHRQLYVALLQEHVDRLLRSARILKLDFDMEPAVLADTLVELLARNRLRTDAYVRPLVYKADEIITVKLTGISTGFAAYCLPMGEYLDVEKGLRLTFSSWRRIDDNAIPARSKAIGSYINAALASDDAREKGFDEALMLTQDGHLAEASSANIFIVSQGELHTPAMTDDILVGITRAALITLAGDLGLRVHERTLDRSEALAADEVFLCGTGVQVAPVASIDGRIIGSGKAGPVTRRLQERYLQVVRGERPDHEDWLRPVYRAGAGEKEG